MKIDYNIIYSKRRTVNIEFKNKQIITVRAPKNYPKERIEDIVEKKKLWIYKQLKKNSFRTYNNKKEFITGETLLFLGKGYELQVTENEFRGIRFNGAFQISKKSRRQAKSIFRQWYRQQAKEVFSHKINLFAKALGVAINRVIIRDMRVSWGSCSPNGTISLNWKLIKAPHFVIDYIIVHELAHLIELNHTQKFWDLVSVLVPRYQKAKSWLSSHGYLLEIDL